MARRRSQEERQFDVEVGKRICAAREAARLTQRRLGESIGLTQQRIGQFESGVRISPWLLRKAAIALGVPLQELVPKVRNTSDRCFPPRIRQRLMNFD